jgi:ParB family transcriptional regulator, chromosome partitioning protein
MQIQEIEIDKIKPDKNQPRTSIDELDLREMGKSIITEGVINPIEIDKNFVIITGERRWRASKLAGLKTVPVKIIEITPKERFMRQVIENIHHNTMSDWDTANALKKLLEYFHLVKVLSKKAGQPQTGITWLSEKTGKSKGYIEEKLDILEMSKDIQKAIKDQKIPGTFIRAIKNVPLKYKKIMEKKILDNEFSTRDGAMELSFALNREQDNPDKIKELLGVDYSKHKSSGAITNTISKISPREHEMIAKTYESSQEISEIVENLKEWVRNNPKESIGKVHIQELW